MRIFRATYKDRDGTKQESAKFYVEFSDHNEITRRLPCFTSEAVTREVSRKLELLLSFRSNGQSPDLDTRRWIETLPGRIVRTLAGWGVLDSKTAAGCVDLQSHLDDWKQAILDRGGTDRWADLAAGRVGAVFEDLGLRYWSDIGAVEIQRHLAALKNRGASPATRNRYLTALKSFAKWMVENKRAVENPLQALKPVNVQTDQRIRRRALTTEEIQRLLAAALKGEPVYGVSGPGRAVVYQLALESGLRLSELKSLERRHFDFERNPPTVTVEAKNAKNRREVALPLRPETARMLQEHMANLMPTARALKMPAVYDGARMLRVDLEAAGIEHTDGAGQRIDFHALRHTFITLLARSGVHPKTAQDLARHSDINLTLSRYSHTIIEQQSEALARLPDLMPAVEADEAVRTGTTDEFVLPVCLPFLGEPGGTSKDLQERGSETKSARKNSGNAIKIGVSGTSKVEPPLGLEPRTCGLQNRCDTSPTKDTPKTCKNSKNVLPVCLPDLNAIDPDLQAVAAAWPSLPAGVRRAVLALVRSANS